MPTDLQKRFVYHRMFPKGPSVTLGIIYILKDISVVEQKLEALSHTN